MRTPLLQFSAAALLTVSCSIHFGDLKETESIEAKVEFAVSPGITTLTIETFNGSLDVIESADSSSGNLITGSSKVWASADTVEEALFRANEMEWVYIESGDQATISLKKPGSRSGNTGGSLRALKIPAGLAVRLDSSNGSLTLTGDCRDFDLQTSNGRITVQLTENWSGKGIARSSNGRIAVRCEGELDCRLDLRTSNGKPKVLGPALDEDNGTGSLKLRTSNGHITVTHLFPGE